MKIVELAKKYLGEKEISGNNGFQNKEFDSLMRKYGFKNGDAWCLHFVRMIYRESGYHTRNISPSAVSSMKLATKSGNWHAEPVLGAVAIFRTFKNGKAQRTGHGAIVSEITNEGYQTIDGNTTDKGGREGIMVAIRNRHLNKDSWAKNDGLRLMGFIYPEK